MAEPTLEAPVLEARVGLSAWAPASARLVKRGAHRGAEACLRVPEAKGTGPLCVPLFSGTRALGSAWLGEAERGRVSGQAHVCRERTLPGGALTAQPWSASPFSSI